jgi:predicted DNA-binding transcriptional regulator YafY
MNLNQNNKYSHIDDIIYLHDYLTQAESNWVLLKSIANDGLNKHRWNSEITALKHLKKAALSLKKLGFAIEFSTANEEEIRDIQHNAQCVRYRHQFHAEFMNLNAQPVQFALLKATLLWIQNRKFAQELHFDDLAKNILEHLSGGDSQGDYWYERIEFAPTNFREENPETLKTLIQAIRLKKRVEFKYKKKTAIFEAQRLYFYKENCYLHAFYKDSIPSEQQGYYTFILDSIEQLAILDEHYEPTPLEFIKGNGYGLLSNGKTTTLARIRFKKKALHRAQKTFRKEEGYRWVGMNLEEQTLDISYTHSEELLNDIIMYGNEAKILSPTELVTEMQEKLRSLIEVYE